MTDASNAPFWNPSTDSGEVFLGKASMGTISVRELEHPLEGKGLALLLKAKELIAAGDVPRGMEKARDAAKYPAAEPYAFGLLATEHMRAGDFTAAVAELRHATRLLPGKAELHSNLAYSLGVLGLNEEAIKEARLAIKLDPARARTRFVLGQILLQLGRKEEARFYLKQAAQELAGARAMLAQYFAE